MCRLPKRFAFNKIRFGDVRCVRSPTEDGCGLTLCKPAAYALSGRSGRGSMRPHLHLLHRLAGKCGEQVGGGDVERLA